MAGIWSRRNAKLTLKLVLAAVVLWAVGRHVRRTWRDLEARGGHLRVEPGWVAAGGAAYLAGLSAFGVVFARTLAASPTPVSTPAALRAYLISHLGKYVPGKAMVVVVRAGLVAPYGARPATAAFASVYETMVMMAAGGLVAAVGFGLGPRPRQILPAGLALGLGLAFLIVVSPRVFPRVAGLVRLPFPGVGPDAQPRYSGRLLGTGLLWSTAGWVLLGLSQVAVVRSVSGVGLPVGLWPLVTAGVALATVAGFVVAVLPGGLGVREGVLMTTLAPALGEETAVTAALLLRLTWVAVEAGAAAVLAVVRPALPEPAGAGAGVGSGGAAA